jgi:3-isopropylmalate/(R)-2-methylmalate dehydratase small subunit
MKNPIEGRARRMGNLIGVYQIYPERYNDVSDPNEMRLHLFEDLDPEFSRRAGAGDIIVAGRLFGLGPRRELAAVALKQSGIACVIAESFDRLFYREAINQGLVALEQPEAREKIKEGEMIQVDLEEAEIRCKKGQLGFRKQGETISRILEAGGLFLYVRDSIAKR